MKAKILYIVLLTFLPALLFSQQASITILHVSDSHSQLDGLPASLSSEGSISRVATIVKQVKATEQNPLFFHSGDFMVGDLFFNKYFGVPELQILNQIGCDAIAVGNHEFDLGPATLLSSLSIIRSSHNVPLVSANLNLNGFSELNAFIKPYIYKNISGIKIGIFGLLKPDPLNNPSPVIVSDSILQIALQTVQSLQAGGASIIICLSHVGFANDSLLASNIPGINFILGGHDHYITNTLKQVVNPLGVITYICHSGDFYRHIGKIKFTYNSGNIKIDNFQMLNVNSSVPKDTITNNIVQTYKTEIQQTYGNVYSISIGTAPNDITAEVNYNIPARDVPLGNLLTDAFKAKTSTEIAITARGLIANKIYTGSIYGADVFRCVPYGYDSVSKLGFNLITCSILASQLFTGLELVLEASKSDESFLPQVSGIAFDYNPNNSIGQKIFLPTFKINGAPFNPAVSYSLTVNEGVFKILQTIGIQVQNVTPTGIPEYIALRDKITALGTVNYTSEGRIRDMNLITNIKNDLISQKKYYLGNNYPNPFNPTTKIDYTIPENTFVSLRIFDITGREVTTLVNSYQQSGLHSVTYNASNISSGLYLYTLNTGNYSETKRMVLIK